MKSLILLLLSCSAGFAWAKQPILVVGDSLSCGPFGERLVKDLGRDGTPVTLYCAVSSAAEHWLAGKNPAGQKCMTRTATSALKACAGGGQVPRMADLLKNHKGARVVMALGTNSLLSSKPSGAYRTLAGLIRRAGAGCDWIGPPHLNPGQARGFSSARLGQMEGNLGSFYPGLRQSVSPACQLVDSRTATGRNTVGAATVDGVHRTKAAGYSWAQRMAAALVKKPVTPKTEYLVINDDPSASR